MLGFEMFAPLRKGGDAQMKQRKLITIFLIATYAVFMTARALKGLKISPQQALQSHPPHC